MKRPQPFFEMTCNVGSLALKDFGFGANSIRRATLSPCPALCGSAPSHTRRRRHARLSGLHDPCDGAVDRALHGALHRTLDWQRPPAAAACSSRRPSPKGCVGIQGVSMSAAALAAVDPKCQRLLPQLAPKS